MTPDEIAAAIAAKLQVTFIPPAQPAGKSTMAEVQAFELVAKGRFDAAIRLDPDNADAHALLGETLVNFMRYGLMPVTRGRPLAKAALDRALELEPTHAEAMGAHALASLFIEHAPGAAFVWWNARGGRRPAGCKPRRHSRCPVGAHRTGGRRTRRSDACAAARPGLLHGRISSRHCPHKRG
ncbi:MAG: hypothetical protein ABI442_12475 [Gemmatimonadaceae bacterium]